MPETKLCDEEDKVECRCRLDRLRLSGNTGSSSSLVTTMMNSGKCKCLLSSLLHDFQLGAPPAPERSCYHSSSG